MKRFVYFFLVLFLASCGNNKTASVSTDTTKGISSAKISVQAILSNLEKGRFKEGELLVKFKSGVLSASSTKTHQSLGSSVLRTYSLVPNLQHVKLPDGLSVRDAVISYMSNPDVEYAVPNYLKYISATTPNDTYFGQQWALNNTGQFAGGTAGADIKAPLAWDISKGASYIVVAVIDSGVDYTHPDLVGNMWINTAENPINDFDNDGNGKKNDFRGWNFFDNNNDPMDDLGHGTHVAGIIGATTNNGFGISGIMWHVQIMPLKFIGNLGTSVCGPGDGFCGTTTDEIAAIQYAVSKGAKIINASFGSSAFDPSEQDAISSANNAGVLYIASAGNDASNIDLAPQFPAFINLPNVISVAATDQNDRRATFSNFGPKSVHVAAPGVYILSTVPEAGVAGSFSALCTGSPIVGYDFCDGTSMAAPQVSGLAGLLYGYYTNFNHIQIRNMVLRYVDVLPELSGWIQTGGRINAYEALSALLTPTDLVGTVASSSSITLTWSDNARHEDGYKIERAVSGGDYVPLYVTGPNAVTFTDSGLDPSVTYSYRVRAINDIGESPDFSNAVSVTTSTGTGTTPSSGGGGGGGCSIGARQTPASAAGNVAVMLIPLVVMVLLRRKKK